LCAPANETINLFLDVNERLLHGVFSLRRHSKYGKQRGGVIHEQFRQFGLTRIGHIGKA
jgi:hypothetical protein